MWRPTRSFKVLAALLLATILCISGTLAYKSRRDRRVGLGSFGADAPEMSFHNTVPADPKRASAVRAAMKHAWDSYVTYAWGYDELDPVARRGTNGFGGMGVTVIDSLGTLKIMGLDEEFEKGSEWFKKNVHFKKMRHVSLFETNIRFLGGLLSVYGLTGDEAYKAMAEDLGTRMLPAFSSASGYPYNNIDLSSGSVSRRGSVSLAEVGTLQLEFLYLAYVTGDYKFAEPAMKVLRVLDKQDTTINRGLGSQSLNAESGRYTEARWTLGAMADSYYEYLLKLDLFTGQHSTYGFRRMWESAAELMREHSVQEVDGKSMVVVGELHRGTPNRKMDHLACFSGGMFAMAHEWEEGGENARIGAGITETCYESYRQMRTGISPEVFQVSQSGDVSAVVSHNLLRPETVESIMILYRLTGDEKFRDWGWEIFQAFEKHSRLATGYAGVRNVNANDVTHDHTQESFFMAETLKYLYLLFESSDVVPLTKFVFNTEAHPLPIPPGHFWSESGMECTFPGARRKESVCGTSEASNTHQDREASNAQEKGGATTNPRDYLPQGYLSRNERPLRSQIGRDLGNILGEIRNLRKY